MHTSAYEKALFGRHFANDDARPPRPNAIEAAKKALGRDNYACEVNGRYSVWENGTWLRNLFMDGFILAANRKLKRLGLKQIEGEPRWRAP